MRRISCWSVVLISIHVPPRRRPLSTPFSAVSTADEAAGEGRQVITASDASAQALGESAQRAPAANKVPAESLFRSWTVSAKPLRTRLAARCAPRLPRPMNP